MAKNKPQTPRPAPPPAPQSGVDAIGLATLAGIVVVLMISFTNMRSLDALQNELGEIDDRVAALKSSGPIQAPAQAAPAAQPARRGPDPNRVYPIKTSGSPVKGPSSAPITIAEFSDFQCPFCSRVNPTLERIQEVYGGNVRVVWKHFPLPSLHPAAPAAHVASEAAHKQNKFWEYHDKLFADQKNVKYDQLVQHARDLGLDVAKFEQDFKDLSNKKTVDEDTAEARSMQLTGTPAFFVNGRYLRGAQPFSGFAKLINEELTRLNLPIPEEARS
ncbi:MAG: thioredoxin domain-containing protein [bacterium]|nr:thioredoxin domain-containing protein [bacterium]